MGTHMNNELKSVGGRLQEVIQKGFPECGWDGDPHLELMFDARREDWVILDTAFNPPHYVLRKSADGIRDLDFRRLCTLLRDGSPKGKHSLMDRIEARNKMVEDEQEYRLSQVRAEVSERVAWELGRTLH